MPGSRKHPTTRGVQTGCGCATRSNRHSRGTAGRLGGIVQARETKGSGGKERMLRQGLGCAQESDAECRENPGNKAGVHSFGPSGKNRGHLPNKEGSNFCIPVIRYKGTDSGQVAGPAFLPVFRSSSSSPGADCTIAHSAALLVALRGSSASTLSERKAILGGMFRLSALHSSLCELRNIFDLFASYTVKEENRRKIRS